MAVDNGLSLVKPFKRLMAMFQTPEPFGPRPHGTVMPRTQRGRVDPYHPYVIAPGCLAPGEKVMPPKREIKPRGDAPGKGGVYRAASGIWEDFTDTQVRPEDDDADTTNT